MELALGTRYDSQQGNETVDGARPAASANREGSRPTMQAIFESFERRAIRKQPELPRVVEILVGVRTADAVFVVSPDHRIVHWDAQAESLTGLMAEEILGKSCHEVLQGECEGGGSFCAHECSVMRLARAGQPVTSYDMCVSTR